MPVIELLDFQVTSSRGHLTENLGAISDGISLSSSDRTEIAPRRFCRRTQWQLVARNEHSLRRLDRDEKLNLKPTFKLLVALTVALSVRSRRRASANGMGPGPSLCCRGTVGNKGGRSVVTEQVHSKAGLSRIGSLNRTTARYSRTVSTLVTVLII